MIGPATSGAALQFPPIMLCLSAAKELTFRGAGTNMSETLIFSSVGWFVAVAMMISLPTVAVLLTRTGMGLLLAVL